MPVVAGLLTAALFLMPHAARLGDIQQDAPEVKLDDVVVEGRRLELATLEFVTQVSAPIASRGPARWHREICVGVSGLRGDAAQAIVDGISEQAFAVGLVPGEPGCKPNLMIFASDDGRRTATELVSARSRDFRTGFSGSDLGSAALRAFQDSDRPIRWWHVSLPVNPDTGRSTQRPPGAAPRSAIGQGARPSEFGHQGSPSTLPSLLRDPLRDDLKQVVIVVDVDGVSSLTIRQLTDYLAMVSLAQVNPDADITGHDSILTIFDPSMTPTVAMTDWDIAFLEGLYKAELEGGRAVSRDSTVAAAMTRELRGLR